MGESEHETIFDASIGNQYFLNKRSHKTTWSLRPVDEWLAELYSLSPPQLTWPVTGRAGRKRAPPPLFREPLAATQSVAAQLPRISADDDIEVESMANPLGTAEEDRH